MFKELFEVFCPSTQNESGNEMFFGDRYHYGTAAIDLDQLADVVSSIVGRDRESVIRVLLWEADLQVRDYPSEIYHNEMSEAIAEDAGEDRDFILDVLLAVDECWETDDEEEIYGRLEPQTVQQELDDLFLALLYDSIERCR